MGQLYMFNTFSSNLVITVNADVGNTYPIFATKQSTGYTPSSASINRGTTASGTVIANGFNTLSLQPVNDAMQPTGDPIPFNLTIPANNEITNDLILYIYRNFIVLSDSDGFVLSKPIPPT